MKVKPDSTSTAAGLPFSTFPPSTQPSISYRETTWDHRFPQWISKLVH